MSEYDHETREIARRIVRIYYLRKDIYHCKYLKKNKDRIKKIFPELSEAISNKYKAEIKLEEAIKRLPYV